jgi:hypothetical protein
MARVKLDKARSALLDRLETMFANPASSNCDGLSN